MRRSWSTAIRDCFDRLRHFRPSLLRAAHARGRARDPPRRSRWRDRSSAGRRRLSSRACPRHGAPIIGTSRIRSIWPRIVSASSNSSRVRAATARESLGPTPRRARVGAGDRFARRRPSYVLGGRAMEVVYSDSELTETWRTQSRCRTTARCCRSLSRPRSRADVDDQRRTRGADRRDHGHVEQAGVHSAIRVALPPIAAQRGAAGRTARTGAAAGRGAGGSV